MGANAQTTVPTFTASQVLTADQMNQSARTGVPVFATTVTRDAAFGGTGEKTLAEGQMCYIEGTGFQTYNGSSWVTWGTAPTPGGLVYLTGASFTTATSFSLPDNTFSATYTNYRLHVVITAVTSDADFTMRLRASGTDATAANYELSWIQADSSASAVSNNSAAGTTSWNVGEQDSGATVQRYRLALDIMAPQLAQPTGILGQLMYVNKAASATFFRSGGGVFTPSNAYDSLSFISSVASSITGSYRVYGYATS